MTALSHPFFQQEIQMNTKPRDTSNDGAFKSQDSSPKGLGYQFAKDGTLSIGGFTIAPEDADALAANITAASKKK